MNEHLSHSRCAKKLYLMRKRTRPEFSSCSSGHHGAIPRPLETYEVLSWVLAYRKFLANGNTTMEDSEDKLDA